MSPSLVEENAIAGKDPTAHVIRELPIVVIMAHSRCNCRCVMCDIWRIRRVREVTAQDLEPHLASLRELKVRWVVFSGGEPLMHSELSVLARLLRREGIRTTLLTAGLLLERHALSVAEDMDDIIVSIDGPPAIHDSIRGVPDAYRRLERGIHAVRKHRPSLSLHGRCTVQRANFRHLRATVSAAQELKLDSLSFLAADMASDAFNHLPPWSEGSATSIALDETEVEEFAREIEALIGECQAEIQSTFIRENPQKLRRLGMHFRAHLGQVAPIAPRCNAPWVSAVIESDGSLRPCFFHPPFGNLQDGRLVDTLNSEAALKFRSQLDVSRNGVCQRCVCSLFLRPETVNALPSAGEE
jgi:Fe-coproporphyrin III synthase